MERNEISGGKQVIFMLFLRVWGSLRGNGETMKSWGP